MTPLWPTKEAVPHGRHNRVRAARVRVGGTEAPKGITLFRNVRKV